RRLDFVHLGHPNLIVFRGAILEGELGVARHVVDQDVNVRQREIILRAGLIEISVVDADSDSPVLLFHRYDICHPLEIVADFEESHVDLFDDLLLDAEEEAGSLLLVKARPDFRSAGFFFGAQVDLLCWLNRGELTVLKATQTLLYLGHLTILAEPFPEVYGSRLFETFFGWVRIDVSKI
ncbi:hypothetical protein CRG98_002338, partial [Punica granatum]